MKTTFTVIVACLLVGVFPVVTLHILNASDNTPSRDFVRVFPPHPFLDVKKRYLEYNSYYFAGSGKQTIYLGNFTTPYHLLSLNRNLDHWEKISLTIEEIEQLSYNVASIKIDSPHIWLIDPLPQKTWYGTITNQRLSPVSKPFAERVSLAMPFNSSAVLYRTFDSTHHSNILKRSSLINYTGDSPSVLLERQVDGLFCTDGTLSYDKATGKFAYMYYYRNEFISFDTALTTVRKGRTIDPQAQANITVDQHRSGRAVTTTLSSPPVFINKQSTLSRDRLFVHAARRAHNEDESVFKKYSVIDVYTIVDGKYRFSFYVPDINGKKVRDFEVIDSMLYVLQDKYMLAYALNL